MRKEFNITGSCNPERHYMVNSEKRFRAIEKLIDAREYFTINRARQYGKTTTLLLIWRCLSERNIVLPLSFEGLGNSVFMSEEAFVSTFTRMVARHLNSMMQEAALVGIWENCAAKSFGDLALVPQNLLC